jgi:hypothetical protein
MDMSLLLLELMTLLLLLASGFGVSKLPVWLNATTRQGRNR